jgi:antitoxin component YwqK of YwqJK toxin-antitoxin module
MHFEYVEHLTHDIFAAQYFTVKIHKSYVNQNGQKHNIYGPACELSSYTGTPILKYYILGNLHREHCPAVIIYYNDHTLRSIEYFRHGRIHRDDGPAEIIYHRNGQINILCWYVNGMLDWNKGQPREFYDEQGMRRSYGNSLHGFL